MQQKGELCQLMDQYEEKQLIYQQLKAANTQLSQQEQLIQNVLLLLSSFQKMSKGKILAVLDKKVALVDQDSKQLEKTFYKEGLDQRSFVEGFLGKRVAFHRYQILKVKVNQS